MKPVALLFLLVSSSLLSAQHNHLKELGLKGRISKLTIIYYAEGVLVNGSWSPKDSSRFTYKTVNWYGAHEHIDSTQTFVCHSGKEKISSVKRYTYAKNLVSGGTIYNYFDDLSYQLSIKWLDDKTYVEESKDESGKNSISTKVYLDNQFHIIKKEDQLIRDGELLDYSITETKFNPDNTEHAVSIIENKVANLEFSLDEYVDKRDAKGNPVKKTYKDGVNNFRSIKYFIIEYAE